MSSSLRRIQASLLVLAAAGGLIAFATFGAFDNRHDPFPHSASHSGLSGTTTTAH